MIGPDLRSAYLKRRTPVGDENSRLCRFPDLDLGPPRLPILARPGTASTSSPSLNHSLLHRSCSTRQFDTTMTANHRNSQISQDENAIDVPRLATSRMKQRSRKARSLQAILGYSQRLYEYHHPRMEDINHEESTADVESMSGESGMSFWCRGDQSQTPTPSVQVACDPFCELDFEGAAVHVPDASPSLNGLTPRVFQLRPSSKVCSISPRSCEVCQSSFSSRSSSSRRSCSSSQASETSRIDSMVYGDQGRSLFGLMGQDDEFSNRGTKSLREPDNRSTSSHPRFTTESPGLATGDSKGRSGSSLRRAIRRALRKLNRSSTP